MCPLSLRARQRVNPLGFPARMANGGPAVPPLAYVHRLRGRKQSALRTATRAAPRSETEAETEMFDLAKTAQARGIAKWCACALLLLAPGSFIVLPLLWVARQWSARRASLAPTPERAPAGAPVLQSSRTALLAE